MTTLVISINCDNDAFFDRAEDEISRILEDYSIKLKSGSTDDYPIIRDLNGNTVGTVEIIY